MKKLFLLFFVFTMAIAIGSGVGLFALTQNQNHREVGMAYCTIEDLQAAYGEDRISAWSRLDPYRVIN